MLIIWNADYMIRHGEKKIFYAKLTLLYNELLVPHSTLNEGCLRSLCNINALPSLVMSVFITFELNINSF